MEEQLNVEVIPADKAKIAKIWKVAGILGVVTTLEFIIAFNMDAGLGRVAIFVGMTIIKAYYIVSEFMHLGHEVKTLIWMILLPMIFVVWLLIALRYEASSILHAITF